MAYAGDLPSLGRATPERSNIGAMTATGGSARPTLLDACGPRPHALNTASSELSGNGGDQDPRQRAATPTAQPRKGQA